MGCNRGSSPPFEPPTDEDIKAAWRAVNRLDLVLGVSVARCVYTLEQVRLQLGVRRPDIQPFNFNIESRSESCGTT